MNMLGKGPKFDMFSDARIAFEQEVRNHHPKIMMQAILAGKESGLPIGETDQGIVIGCAAAKFNIIMDGAYSPEQIEDLYDLLFHRLRDSRKEIILA